MMVWIVGSTSVCVADRGWRRKWRAEAQEACLVWRTSSSLAACITKDCWAGHSATASLPTVSWSVTGRRRTPSQCWVCLSSDETSPTLSEWTRQGSVMRCACLDLAVRRIGSTRTHATSPTPGYLLVTPPCCLFTLTHVYSPQRYRRNHETGGQTNTLTTINTLAT